MEDFCLCFVSWSCRSLSRNGDRRRTAQSRFQQLELSNIIIPWVRPSSASLGASVREWLDILMRIIAECCFFWRGHGCTLGQRTWVYLFLSGATDGFLDGKTAAQTSCCNYTSKPCRTSFHNNVNYSSSDIFLSLLEHLKDRCARGSD